MERKKLLTPKLKVDSASVTAQQKLRYYKKLAELKAKSFLTKKNEELKTKSLLDKKITSIKTTKLVPLKHKNKNWLSKKKELSKKKQEHLISF